MIKPNMNLPIRAVILCVLLCCGSFIHSQKILIHSHNDYEQAGPLVNALENKVYSLEADIYLLNDTLKVAHDKKNLTAAPSLLALYIQPIVHLFQDNHGQISSDKNYSPILMIDIKENGEAALSALVKLLSAHPSVFDRKVNKKAVQVVISGDRGNIAKWTSWPSYILFDGRFNEHYDKAQLKRVAFISDSYFNYAKQKETTDSLIKQLATKAHQIKKPLRLWAIPDNPASWTHLRELGVDIINTDKVAECRKYFSEKN
jgi:alkaline phosphatase